MRTTLILSVSLLFSLSLVHSQNRYTLSGTITEATSNETLIGVTVAIPELGTGVVTNEYGFYSISLPSGNYEVRVSFIGFQNILRTISLDDNKKINFELVGLGPTGRPGRARRVRPGRGRCDQIDSVASRGYQRGRRCFWL